MELNRFINEFWSEDQKKLHALLKEGYEICPTCGGRGWTSHAESDDGYRSAGASKCPKCLRDYTGLSNRHSHDDARPTGHVRIGYEAERLTKWQILSAEAAEKEAEALLKKAERYRKLAPIIAEAKWGICYNCGHIQLSYESCRSCASPYFMDLDGNLMFDPEDCE